MKKTEPKTYRLNADVYAGLQRLSKQTGLNASDLVDAALDLFLDGKKPVEVAQAVNARRGRLLINSVMA
jgi:hypothetical protein